jgi:hypothetical protein
MDGLTLLQRAREAGLRLEAADTSLKISGPRNADPLVRLLAEHKTQVLDALRKVQEVPETEGGATKPDGGPYASTLAALRANCPAYVPEDRWHQAIADATAFATKWGAQAHTLGWTTHELLALHPVPEQPAPNYDRLARLDDMGLLWLLRGRPVVELTSMEAVIRCHSGATVKFYRPTEPVPPTEITNGAPTMGGGHADRHDHCRPRLAAEIANAGNAKKADLK